MATLLMLQQPPTAAIPHHRPSSISSPPSLIFTKKVQPRINCSKYGNFLDLKPKPNLGSIDFDDLNWVDPSSRSRFDVVIVGAGPAGLSLAERVSRYGIKDFYEELFEELSKYGELESLNIFDNLAGRPVIVDFSPVMDFREATCGQYEENVCNRGGYCNFMHLKKISRELRRQLFGRSSRRRESRSPPRYRSYEDRPIGGRGYGRRDDGRYQDRDRRPRSRSPARRGRRSRSPGERRNRSPVRENSAERRARIEQWNREKEQVDPAKEAGEQQFGQPDQEDQDKKDGSYDY